MKYCSKCGNELLDEAVICPKCGCPVEHGQGKSIIDESNRSTAKKDLFAGHLLNIFAFIVPVIILAFLLVRNDGSTLIGNITSDIEEHPADVEVTVTSDISSNGLSIAVVGGVVIFLIGLAVYFLKQKHIKTVLAYIYLIMAIADFALFFFVWSGYILATCFLGAVALIPGILQIRAGTKFIVGCKHYEG